MNFLEKDLETIIWESPAECEARGFDLLQMQFFGRGRRFRQMQLGPYGIADLISIYYNPRIREAWIQVIECKRERVNGDTYLQAKRYATAAQELVYSSALEAIKMNTSIILVGSTVDGSGPLCHVVSSDPSCTTYTYRYAVDGIRFERADFQWRASTFLDMPGFFGASVRGVDEYRLAEDALCGQLRLEHGDGDLPILITSAGVLVNENLINLSSYGPAN